MAWSNPNFISLGDVYIAYRKAKKEAFSDTNCAHAIKFANYESDLFGNLSRLLCRLNRNSPAWQNKPEFLGSATCIAKSVAPVDRDDPVHFQSGNPMENWKTAHRIECADADFRIVIDASIDYMIISVLWILKVGCKFDASLDRRYALGNRVRRWRPSTTAEEGTVGELNLDSHMLFQPYYGAYAAWRERGLRMMRKELEAGHQILAITMDLKQFYHRVDASFLLDPTYLKVAEVELTMDEEVFTRQLIQSIKTWNCAANIRFGCGLNGLPVGLTASALIANVLLVQFDSHIATKLAPSYYGRYVDDVFLVLRQEQEFKSGEAFLDWLGDNLSPIATYKKTGDEPGLCLNLPYAKESKLIFVRKKQKIFQLHGQYGLDLINPIEEQIRRQSSEHRAFPEVPDSEAAMADRALLVTSDATLLADALRKADVVTLRRASFAMLLSDIEEHARDLEPESWQAQREQFYGLAERHLLQPQGFFDYPRYFPRIFGLMVVCNDLDAAKKFIDCIYDVVNMVRDTCGPMADNFQTSLDECCYTLGKRMVEAALQSYTEKTSPAALRRLLLHVRKCLSNRIQVSKNRLAIVDQTHALLLCDWARVPYAKYWVAQQNGNLRRARGPKDPNLRRILHLSEIETFRRAANLPQPRWTAISFPTRAIPLPLITIRAPRLLENYELFRDVVRALRGVWIPDYSPMGVREPTTYHPCQIIAPLEPACEAIVAITNFKTTEDEWNAAIDNAPILSHDRYRRLNRLLELIIELNPRPNYVLLSECSLPQGWAISMASRLLINHISLIAGLEYRRSSQGLHNEALVALCSTFPGYRSSICLLHPKQKPAWEEKRHIMERVHLNVVEQGESDPLLRPIYIHGDFCFGVLICSDLTDIRNRAHFQGKIDCLFVPEWNSDLDTFASLVEAAALDVHAFVAQANNRCYSDSRIRAPFKKNYRRDVIRLRGGLHDYVVAGKIEYIPLRDFQSNDAPPQGNDVLFKPFPIGFRISELRRTN